MEGNLPTMTSSTKFTFVTSFNEEGYKKYGKRFIEGYIKYFPKECDLFVFTENVDAKLPVHNNVRYIDLLGSNEMTINEMTTFINRWKDVPEVNGPNGNYRYDGVKFSKIIFSLTEMIDHDTDWLIRIDSDIIVNKKITNKQLETHLDCGNECLAHYMGRKDWHHSETSFMAFNMKHPEAKEFLKDFRWFYTSGEIMQLQEYTDSWVFDHIRKRYEEDNIYFHNMSKDKPGMDVWGQTWLGEYMEHLKGPIAKKESADDITREQQLIEVAAEFKPITIVETGTGDGLRAIAIAEEIFKKKDAIHYFGFDLFDKESEEAAQGRFHIFRNNMRTQGKKFSFSLFKGDTNDTLPKWFNIDYILKDVGTVKIIEADMAIIAGGKSIKTITNDYEHLKKCKLIVIDGFYSPDEDGKMPDLKEYGSNELSNSIQVKALPIKDKLDNGGYVSFVTTGIAVNTNRSTLIKTQNCVSDPHIQGNVRYSTQYSAIAKEYKYGQLKEEKENIETRLVELDLAVRELNSLKPIKWVLECKLHHNTAVIISGGPSVTDPTHAQYKANHKKIKQLSKRKTSYLFCVKHSHDHLIEENVIPFGCFLLDPRDHVKDFIEDPHPDVKYFVASMCAQTTWDRLLERDAQIWGYHALVGAAEQDVLKEISPKSRLISGGSSSATRGIAVARALGFMNFIIIGQDSCYWEDQDMEKLDVQGRKKYQNVVVAGRKFLTDPELMAACQDFEQIIKSIPECEFEVFGDGMVSHVFKQINPNKPLFIDLFSK